MEKGQVAGWMRDIAGVKNVKLDAPMKEHTSFKVGGPADILVFPKDRDVLGRIIKTCKIHEIPFFVFGNGSNLIVRDKGIRGVVIKLFDNFAEYSVEGDRIEASAGMLLSKLSKIALEQELSGLEFAEGIPGTLGGAVTMNAGAYGGEMKDIVFKTEFMDANGDVGVLEGTQHQFGYRTSYIQKEKCIVLTSQIQLKKGNKTEIHKRMNECAEKRKDKQPLEMPSAGSVFKRPEGYFTGKLVEDCGLKGHRIGGAEVSGKHCGFIVNVGNATSEDILCLIKHIQDNVKMKFGVALQTEVRIVGEE